MEEYTELIKTLRHCATRSNGCVTCAGCPMSSENGDVIECINALHKDAAAAIEALMDAEKTYLAELAQCHENLRRAAETRRERDERIEALQTEVKRLQDKLCDWCAVCPKERRRPEDCELLGENPVMYGPSGAKMEVQDADR